MLYFGLKILTAFQELISNEIIINRVRNVLTRLPKKLEAKYSVIDVHDNQTPIKDKFVLLMPVFKIDCGSWKKTKLKVKAQKEILYRLGISFQNGCSSLRRYGYHS